MYAQRNVAVCFSSHTVYTHSFLQSVFWHHPLCFIAPRCSERSAFCRKWKVLMHHDIEIVHFWVWMLELEQPGIFFAHDKMLKEVLPVGKNNVGSFFRRLCTACIFHPLALVTFYFPPLCLNLWLCWKVSRLWNKAEPYHPNSGRQGRPEGMQATPMISNWWKTAPGPSPFSRVTRLCLAS